MIFISACDYQNILKINSIPKLDKTLESVNKNSLRSISDINSIAFEWQKVNDSRIDRYYFYRTSLENNSSQLKLIKIIKNRYTTHYVDNDLKPNTTYKYSIASGTNNGFQSKLIPVYRVSTLPILEGVSFIQAISDLPKQIKILWRPHESHRITGYILKKKSPIESKWKVLKEIDGRLNIEYIDNNLKDNIVYMYKVTAITFDNIKTKSSKIVQAQTKELPLGVQNLFITNDQPKKITLRWDKSKSKNIIKYNIYRSNKSKNGFTKIVSLNSDILMYDDIINKDGAIRFYKVTSVDSNNLETALNMNSMMGNTLVKIKKPIVTLAQIKDNKIILNWKSGDTRTVSYIVHKSVKETFFKFKNKKIKNIIGLRFEDKSIIKGLEYVYNIQGVDEFGILSDKTDYISLKPPKFK